MRFFTPNFTWERKEYYMVMELKKEQICINQSLGMQKDIFHIENDIIVNDIKPDVLSIIDTNGILCVNKKEIVDGKVRLEGEVNANIVYIADDENSSIRCLNACINFNQSIDLKKYEDGMNINVSCKIKDLESIIINGRKINIKVAIEVQSNLYLDTNVDIINNIDSIQNMQVLKTNERIITTLGKGTTKVNAKDTISVSEEDNVAEIMNVRLNVIDKEVKTSYNKILIKADADVEILYITENNNINSINTRIPIMGFIDMQDVNEECTFNINDTLNNMIIKINSQEEHSIYVEAEIEFNIGAFKTLELDVVEDLYMTMANVSAEQKNVGAIVSKENICEEKKIAESIKDQELAGGTIHSTSIEKSILKETIRAGKIIYEGELLIKILYSKNQKLNLKRLNIPFNFEIESNKITSNSLVNREITVRNESFILQDDTLNISLSLIFDINIEENKELRLIENITIDETMEKSPYSMVIYFVKPGDTLWKIAKKFKSTMEEIAKVNDIENKDKINIGEQLYIPRCVNMNG